MHGKTPFLQTHSIDFVYKLIKKNNGAPGKFQQKLKICIILTYVYVHKIIFQASKGSLDEYARTNNNYDMLCHAQIING